MNDNSECPSSKESEEKLEYFTTFHICAFCGTKFNNPNSLKLHVQLHGNNNDFTCLLCKEVFADLQQLKLHDLRHSMEEAHEDLSDIETIVLHSEFISCNVCREKFSSDEELVNHRIIHPQKEEKVPFANVQSSNGHDHDSDSSESTSGDENPIKYRILRQETVDIKSGKSREQHIRFTLIDQHDVQVEEITRTIIPKKMSPIKKSVKVDSKKKRVATISGNKTNKIQNGEKRTVSKKKSYAKIKPSRNDLDTIFEKVSKTNRRQRQNKLLPPKRKTSVNKTNKIQNGEKNTRKNSTKIDSSDSDIDIIFEKHGNSGKSERQNKLLALKKKIVANKTNSIQKRNKRAETKKKSGDKIECSGNDDVDIIFESAGNSDGRQRQSKVLALKKKIWKDKYENPRMKKALSKFQGEFIYKCDKCQITFSQLDHLKKHKQNLSLHQNLKVCPVCNKSFAFSSKFNRHCQTHKNALEYSCKHCTEKLNTESLLRQHVIDHHSIKAKNKYNCGDCRKLFDKKEDFDHHIKEHSLEKNIICEKCRRKYANFDSLRNHRCENPGKVLCEICKKFLSQRRHLRRHLYNVHKLGKAKVDSLMNVHTQNNNLTADSKEAEDLPLCSFPETESQSNMETDVRSESKLIGNESVSNQIEDPELPNINSEICTRSTNSIKICSVKKKPTTDGRCRKNAINVKKPDSVNKTMPPKKTKCSSSARKQTLKNVLLKKKTKGSMATSSISVRYQSRANAKKSNIKSKSSSVSSKRTTGRIINKLSSAKMLSHKKNITTANVKKITTKNLKKKGVKKSASALIIKKKLKK